MEAIGGDVFMRSLAVLAPGSRRIISAQDPTQLGRCVHKTFVPIRYFLYPDRYQSGQVSVLIDYRVIKPHTDRCFSLEKMPKGILIVNGGIVGGNLL